MSVTEELVANVVRTRFDTIDEESIERAKWRLVDAMGCLMAGANAPGCRETAELIRKWGGAQESTVLVHNIKAPAHNVALVNSLMIRSFDFEPVEAEVKPSRVRRTSAARPFRRLLRWPSDRPRAERSLLPL